MTSGKQIFYRSDGSLVALEQTPYEAEKFLQEAVANFPEVIAGVSTASDEPLSLLLITQEMPVPTPEGGRGMSLDHLFVDANGVPVLVEVKRASDTRIRREVIGQVLEYAAVGVPQWTSAQLREIVRGRIPSSTEESEYLGNALATAIDADAFWETVGRNLENGNVRMIVVADDFPVAFERIIVFLNEQMRPAEILGVEVMQYRAGDHLVYVPRAVGATSRAQAGKPATGNRWTIDRFKAVLDERQDAEQQFVRALLEDVEQSGGTFRWGSGTSAGVGGWYPIKGKQTASWALYLGAQPGDVSFVLWTPSLEREAGPPRLEEVAQKLASIPALAERVSASRNSGWSKKPTVKVSALMASEEALSTLLDALALLRKP